MTRLILVRHGRASDVDGRCIGQTDVTLSETGANEIRALASRLATITPADRLISSDLSRARQSGEIIAGVVSRQLEVDPRLREMNFGDWDGRAWSDIERDDREQYDAWMTEWFARSAPNGETVADLAERAADWLDTIRGVPETLVVVSHAGWIRAVLCLLLGRDLSSMFEIPVDHGRLTAIDVSTEGTILVASNVEEF